MANWFLGRALAEEAEAENAAWSFLGEGVTFWVTVAVLLVVGVAVYLVTRKKSNKKSFWTAKTMAVGAMCMALSSVLSLIKLWPMPMGGSVTPASMLPFVLDGGAWAALGLIPNLLDYPIAFAMTGLAGCFRGSKAKMAAGFVLGCFGRFMASFLSGFIFYGQYAPEGVNPVWYSLTYNGSYMLVECIICIALGLLVGERLAKELKKVA